jgi:hypothetical protein
MAPDPDRWRDRGVPEQLVQMAYAALRLAERPRLRPLGRWVHMLGFRGHSAPSPAATPRSSPNYARPAPPTALARTNRATTLRCATTLRSTTGFDGRDLVSQYLGSGYLNPGDVLLAAGVEPSLRVAREALHAACVTGHRKPCIQRPTA